MSHHAELSRFAGRGILLSLLLTAPSCERQKALDTEQGPLPEKRGAVPKTVANEQRSHARTVAQAPLTRAQAERLALYRTREPELPTGDWAELRLPELTQRYRRETDPLLRQDMLWSLNGRADEEAGALARQAALEELDAESRVTALTVLQEYARADDVALVEAALAAADPMVRLAGVELLSAIRAEAALPMWQKVLGSSEAELVQFGFEMLAEASEPVQVAAASQALRRNEGWIIEQALTLLGGITSKPAVEALIPFLDHPQSGDLAQDGLFFQTGEWFDNRQAAQQWWLENKNRLDSELQPLELR
jgi:hypothetical protein